MARGGLRRKLLHWTKSLYQDNNKITKAVPQIFLADRFKRKKPGKVATLEVFSGFAEISIQFARKGETVGEPVDLMTGWDLYSEDDWQKLLKYIHDTEPELLVIAFPCTVWCALQNMNIAKDPAYKAKLEAPRKHEQKLLQRTRDLFLLQTNARRQALIENPWSSQAWHQPPIQEILSHPSAISACCDMCTVGLKGPNNGFLRKRTRFRSHGSSA